MLKRFGPYVLAVVLGAAAGYLFSPKADPKDVGDLNEKLATCESALKAETGAKEQLADELVETTESERALQARVDRCEGR